MKITFDHKKSEKNALERGLPFELAHNFEWDGALYTVDTRKTYTEQRIIGLGYLHDRLHVICFTPIPNGVRVISFRKANTREIRRYEQEIID
jgi:uncharacterized DUF497 family protein